MKVLIAIDASAVSGQLVDEAVARTATLGLSDFPRDWEADSDSEDSAARADCQTLDRAQAVGRAHAQSPKYTSQTAYAASEVLVFADAVTATHWFTELADSRDRRVRG